MTVQDTCVNLQMYKKNILLEVSTKLENSRYEDVINNIKRIINEKGMKQGIVAERAGFTKQEFSNVLNDRRKLLRVEHIVPIAESLGVEPNDLYGISPRGADV